MNGNQQAGQQRLCRSCGEDITQHARYTRWTQCGYCYWKERLDHGTPVGELLGKRNELKSSIEDLQSRFRQTNLELHDLERHSYAKLPRWKRFLGISPADGRLDELRRLVGAVEKELSELRRAHESLEVRIRTARHVRQRFDAAARARTVEETRRQRKGEFISGTFQQGHNSEYLREYYRIRNKDYKRGNPLDNHFRGALFDTVISTFEGRCVYCSSGYDLTLDHFAIPKNEGGNFILLAHDGTSIKLNLVVLCRSCNAAKGERSFAAFFTKDQLERALAYHRKLLPTIIEDENTMSIVRKWYRK